MISPKTWLIGGAFLALSLFAGYQTVQLADERTLHAVDNRKAADAATAAANLALAEALENAGKVAAVLKDKKESVDEAHKQTEALAARVVASDASVRGLSERVARLVATSRARPNGAPSVDGSRAADDSIGMLADVLGRCDRRAELLAVEADKRRIAGLACQREYESVEQRFNVRSSVSIAPTSP